MKKVFWPILLGTISLIGCAAPTPNAATQTAAAGTEAPKQICTKEVALGSQIPHTVCRTPGSGADGVEAFKNAMAGRPDTTYKP